MVVFFRSLFGQNTNHWMGKPITTIQRPSSPHGRNQMISNHLLRYLLFLRFISALTLLITSVLRIKTKVQIVKVPE